jgi:hypothetical protein
MNSMRKTCTILAGAAAWLALSATALAQSLGAPGPGAPPPYPAPYVQSTLTSGNALSGLVTNPVTAGLIAEYPLNDGSGTTCRDISGNGATCTFASGSNAPMWMSYGVGFMNPTAFGTSTPTWLQTNVKTWLTAVIYACPATLPQTTSTGTGGTPYAPYAALLGTPGTSDGVYVFGSGTSFANEYVGALNPSVFKQPAATFITTSAAPVAAPCAAIGVTLSTLDHIYANGIEINYTAQGTSAASVTTATAGYQIGDANNNIGEAFKGVIAYVVLYSTILTQPQIAQVSAFEAYQVQNRVGFPTPTHTLSQTPAAVFTGDSLTATYEGTAGTNVVWPAQTYLSLNSTYTISDYGVGGTMPQTLEALELMRACSAVAPGAGHNVAHLWIGTNAVAQSGYTAAQTWASSEGVASTR